MEPGLMVFILYWKYTEIAKENEKHAASCKVQGLPHNIGGLACSKLRFSGQKKIKELISQQFIIY